MAEFQTYYFKILKLCSPLKNLWHFKIRTFQIESFVVVFFNGEKIFLVDKTLIYFAEIEYLLCKSRLGDRSENFRSDELLYRIVSTTRRMYQSIVSFPIDERVELLERKYLWCKSRWPTKFWAPFHWRESESMNA